jgi:cob(I)alamin adenosyltransferase
MARLTKIYTRTGDKGTTGLADGSRVAKDHPRIEAIGTVDELNSSIGLLRSRSLPEELDELLLQIQHELFDLGSELSVPGRNAVDEACVKRLEQALDHYNADLPVLEEFILPAGGDATAHCHMARTICRRAERRVYTAANVQEINPQANAYLNRLSDLLFVVARVLARFENGSEVLWQPKR